MTEVRVEREELACRFCASPLERVFVDLGASPLANSYLPPDALLRPEPFYPLRVYVCDQCLLVQLPEFESPESIFEDYAYFSSYSDSLARSRSALRRADGRSLRLRPAAARSSRSPATTAICCSTSKSGRFPFSASSRRPTWRPARRAKGIPTGSSSSTARPPGSLSQEGMRRIFCSATTCWRTCPTSTTSSRGLKVVLAPGGVLTMEFPHLLAADGREPVRHHLPRALLVLLASPWSGGSSPATA